MTQGDDHLRAFLVDEVRRNVETLASYTDNDQAMNDLLGEVAR